MKSFLLLILSLMTGCVASFRVKGCRNGWVEFSCYYQGPEEEYDSCVVKGPNNICIRSTVQNVWKKEGRFSLYHDTTSQTLNVTIKQLKPKDFGGYKCQFKKSSHEEEEEVEVKVNIKVEKKRCQTPFIHKASTETNITFDYPVDDMLDDMLFFCKENDFTCEDIFTTKSSPKSNERFTLKETKRGLTISISHVSPSDAGVYWCGVETEHYRAALGQIQLEVKGHSTLTIIIAVVVCAVLLVLVLILVFIYKRIQRSKNTRKEETQNNKEDRTYEEIQERPQEPDSGTAIKTIYTTANFHTNPSPDIHYYSNSSFKNSSVEVSAGDPYSTVNNNDQHPTYSTVNHPSGLPDDPCYSTVNNPQQP